jgi:hypothetical protein
MRQKRLEKKFDVSGIIDMIERSRKCNLVQSGKYTEEEVEKHPELWKSRFGEQHEKT